MKPFDLSNTVLSTCESIVSDHEKKLYHVLIESLDRFYPDQYVVCPKIRIGDIITMKKEDFEWGTRQRYKSRHFDFLICSKEDLKPVLAVELQDASHKTKKGKYVDLLKTQLCEHAGLNLLQLWTINPLSIKKLLYYRLQENLQTS